MIHEPLILTNVRCRINRAFPTDLSEICLLYTSKEVGRIENLTSPRYIHFLSDEKAYVTQLWDNRIFIINPKKYEILSLIHI